MTLLHPGPLASASATETAPNPPLLKIEDFSLEFRTRQGRVQALDQIGLSLARGEILGVVGESGSGKSVLAFAIMGLNDPAARVTGGSLTFAGWDMLSGDEAALAELRGREVSMVFQSPRTALNPIRRVGRQIEDVLRQHANLPSGKLREAAIEALASVQIPDPVRRYQAYPFELSGGLCQRVMIAMAMACKPLLLIADEPTTGLDVTTQAVVMDLIRDKVRAAHTAVLLITHDLALAGEYCNRIAVMHAGHVVEVADARTLRTRPRHPYTARLLGATPGPGMRLNNLTAIAGNLPDLRAALPPCRFVARCDRASTTCREAPLPSRMSDGGHLVRCHHPL